MPEPTLTMDDVRSWRPCWSERRLDNVATRLRKPALTMRELIPFVAIEVDDPEERAWILGRALVHLHPGRAVWLTDALWRRDPDRARRNIRADNVCGSVGCRSCRSCLANDAIDAMTDHPELLDTVMALPEMPE